MNLMILECIYINVLGIVGFPVFNSNSTEFLKVKIG